MISTRARVSVGGGLFVFVMLVCAIALVLLYQPTQGRWSFSLLSDYQWQLRWPRALAAVSAGAGLAIAGTILQRLVYNPLASPDILGVSSGATFTVVIATLLGLGALTSVNWLVAFSGSFLVLLLLLVLGRRHQYASSSLILTGIAITATLQAFVQFCLAKGSQDSYQILQWLAGSTYRVTGEQAILLSVFVIIGVGVACLCGRWLTLISVGRSFAMARGVNLSLSSVSLLVIVALMCAVVTATIGPVSFVGLIAPHIAAMLGAHRARQQLIFSALTGITLMLWSDWLGQIVLFPNQIAAGTVVAILGALYFLLLLLSQRMSKGA